MILWPYRNKRKIGMIFKAKNRGFDWSMRKVYAFAEEGLGRFI